MHSYVFDGDTDSSHEQMLEEEGIESSEEGFMKGYDLEDEPEECEECGSAIDPEKKVVRKFNGEVHVFCCKVCADEFEENMS